MNKHTPGPWKVGFKHDVNCNGFDGSDTDTAYFIAKKDGYQDKSEAEANACLIAAAPELLAQLKYVREVLVNWLPGRSSEVVSECNIIIAKAEGNEK